MRKFFFSGGFLLAGGAIFSKFLGFLRDRIFLEIFPPEKIDFIFAALRIPDFFYFLFVGGTVAVIFIPAAAQLSPRDTEKFFGSFFCGVAIFFGIFSAAGFFAANFLVEIFAAGFSAAAKIEIAALSRYFFIATFLLALSSVFAAELQRRQQFFSVAAGPIFFSGAICVGTFFFGEKLGFSATGISAIFGAAAHFFLNFLAAKFLKIKLNFFWQKPKFAFKNFWPDFWRRILNNSAFQINYSADILIASFLAAGTATAFSIGANCGQVFFSIVGFPLASSAFPKLAAAKNLCDKKKIFFSALQKILIFTLPAAIFGAIFAREILQIFFNLHGENLQMAATTFFWIILSTPAHCAIPLFSRVFFSAGDTKTPFFISSFSLLFSTFLAAILSLKILEKNQIFGLAFATFFANFLSVAIFAIFFRRLFLQK